MCVFDDFTVPLRKHVVVVLLPANSGDVTEPKEERSMAFPFTMTSLFLPDSYNDPRF